MVEKSKFATAAAVLALWMIGAGIPARAIERATVAIPAVSPSFVVQAVADDHDLWAKYGVDLKSVAVPGVGAVNAVLSGSVDFAESAAASPLRAARSGQHLLIIATLMDRLYVQLVMRRTLLEAASFDPTASLAARVKVLPGRTIAVEAIGGAAFAYLRVLAALGGFGPDDVRVAPMLQSSMEAAFAANAIDGFVAGPPYSAGPVDAGAGLVVASGPDGDPDSMVPFGYIVMLTRPELCTKRRALCVGIGHALREAAAYVCDNPDGAAASVKKRFPTLDRAIFRTTMKAVLNGTPRIPVTSAAELEHADLFNVAAGLTKPEQKRTSYDDLFTNEYIR
ncbi:MAG TPA: ABC transporter substrate-binding protein [Stellaceae bacterium]|nr:ABC transporter substrate-binding protein [Stellaceae bacterium]